MNEVDNRVWTLTWPTGSDFASVVSSPRGRVFRPCCGTETVGSLEWEPGGGLVGDFAWHKGSGSVLLRQSAVERLTSFGIRDFDCLPVEILGAWPGGGSDGATAEGYCELKVRRWVDADLAESKVKRPTPCDCGALSYEPRGVESRTLDWDPNEGAKWTRSVRRPGMGFVVRAAELAGSTVFRLRQWPTPLFCTATARRAIEDAGLSNVDFLDYGEIRE